MATRSGAMGIAHSSVLPEMKNVALDGWSNMGLHISGVKEKASQSFINFRQKQCLNGRIDLPDMRSIMSSHSKSIQDCLKKFQNHIHSPKGMSTHAAQASFRHKSFFLTVFHLSFLPSFFFTNPAEDACLSQQLLFFLHILD